MNVVWIGKETLPDFKFGRLGDGETFKFPAGRELYIKVGGMGFSHMRYAVCLSSGTIYCHSESETVVPIKAKVVAVSDGMKIPADGSGIGLKDWRGNPLYPLFDE